MKPGTLANSLFLLLLLLSVPVAVYSQQDIKITNGGAEYLSGDGFDFDEVMIDYPVANFFIIENVGDADLTLNASDAITLSGTDVASFVVDTDISGEVLAPGDKISFDVTMNPSSAGAKSATINIDSDDPADDPFTIDLSGTALEKPAACTIPTAGFESFANGSMVQLDGFFEANSSAAYRSPSGWSPLTSLALALFGGTINVNETADSHSGAAALELFSDGSGFADAFVIFPCSTQPDALKGYYKFTDASVDSAMVVVSSGGGDEANRTETNTDTLYIKTDAGTYTEFNLNFLYDGSSVDSLLIALLITSNGSSTSFKVDDVELVESSMSPSLNYATSIDISNAKSTGSSFSVSGQETFPQGLAFNREGTKMFVVGANGDAVYEYELGTAFDLETANYTTSISVASQDSYPSDICFNNDGTKMYITGRWDTYVNEYNLSTAYDINSAVYSTNFFVFNEEITPQGLEFNIDGTKMYICGSDGQEINEYKLNSAFDVSSASFNASFSVASEDMNPLDLTFNKNGTRMYVAGGLEFRIFEYSLATPFDISSAVYLNNFLLSPDYQPGGITFNNSGTSFYLVSLLNKTVDKYNLDDAAFNELASNNGSLEGSMIISIYDDTFTNAGGALTSGADYSIDNLPMGLSPVLEVAANGLTATLTLSGNAVDHDQENDITDLQFTFENSAFTGNDASSVHNATGASSELGIDFEGNPVLTYSSRLDVTHPDKINYDGSPFDVSAQESNPKGITFSPDGMRMFIVGTEDGEVNQYSLLKSFDITGGVSYDGSPLDVSSEDTGPVDIAFSQDGMKMFILGQSDKEVNQYSLTTAFDITSGVSYDGTPFDCSPQLSLPSGFAFSTDGAKMFIIGGLNKEVNQYSLTIPFDITSGVSFDGNPLDVFDEASWPYGIDFNNDGTRMFIQEGLTEFAVNQYTLTNPFDITSGVNFNGSPFDLSSEMASALNITMSALDTRMFIIGNEGIYQYSMSPIDFTEAGSNDGSVEGDMIISLVYETFTNSGSTLASPADFSITNLPSGLTANLSIASNGLSAELILSGNADIHENANDVSGLLFSFENAAFSGGDASIVLNANNANSGAGIDFENNNPPVYNSPSSIIITENSITTILDVNADNGEGGADDAGITYSISGGDDQSQFVIDSNNGELGFVSPPDFENPEDMDSNNEYIIEITADDGINSTIQTITVTVTNEDEVPVFTSTDAASFDENGTDIVLDVNATDGDGGEEDADITYSLSGGDDQNIFEIDETSGSLSFLNPPDYENPEDADGNNEYLLTVTADDGNLTADQTITISVIDVTENADPIIEDQSFSIDENSPNGTTVGIISAFDVDGDDLTFTITTGNENEIFSINSSTWELTVNNSSALDFETSPSFILTIEVDDGNGGTATATITIILNDLLENLPPTISDQSFSIDENSADGTIVGTVAATDPDGDDLTFEILSGNTGSAFSIDPSTAELKVNTSSELDFETIQKFELVIEVDDGNGGTASATITINIIDVDQTITFTSISDKTYGDEPFNLIATASSELPVEFEVVSGPAELNGNAVTLTGPGQVTIRATQPGNEQYDAADPVEQTFCVNPPKPVITSSFEGFESFTLNSSSDEGNQWFMDGEILEEETGQELSAEASGAYSVQVTIDGCTSEVSDDFEVIITGIEPAGLSENLRVYPNPASDRIYLELRGDGYDKDMEVIFYDMKGRILGTRPFRKDRDVFRSGFSTRQLPEGTYLFVIKGETLYLNGRFQKK